MTDLTGCGKTPLLTLLLRQAQHEGEQFRAFDLTLSLTKGERLSWKSSVLPWSTVSEDGVEDGEELTHDGGEGELLGFAGGEQASVEAGQDGVVMGSDEGGHVEHGADLGPAAPGCARAAPGAAVTVYGGDTDQGGDLFVVELAEFR